MKKSLLTKLGETWDIHKRSKEEIHSPEKIVNLSKWLPTRGNVLFTLLVVGTLFFAQGAGAFPNLAPAAPSTSTISYQGRLADSNGDPLTQTVNMEFRVYNSPSGGTPLWEELWTGGNSIQVSDGLFNVMLGSITTNLASIVQNQDELYLGITVGTDNEMSPRVQLGSVPFSMQALTVPDASITKSKLANDVHIPFLIGETNSVPVHFKSDVNDWIAIDSLATEINLEANGNILVSLSYREQRNYDLDYYGLRVMRDGVQVFTSHSVIERTGVHNLKSLTFLDKDLNSGSHTYTVEIQPRGKELIILSGSTISLVGFGAE